MTTTFRLQGHEFEWDEVKAISNLEKHGVTFEEAAEVFLDPFYQVGDDGSSVEERIWIIGYSLALRLLFVVHTERGEHIRIISARPATRAERKLYEDGQ
jgi:uncharacterized protein